MRTAKTHTSNGIAHFMQVLLCSLHLLRISVKTSDADENADKYRSVRFVATCIFSKALFVCSDHFLNNRPDLS